MKGSAADWICRKAGSCDLYYNRRTGKISYACPYSDGARHCIEVPSHPNAPLRVYLDPTYRCNLSCRHCITNSSALKVMPNQLPMERFFSILTEFSQIGTLEVAITGGEPLCYPGIVPLVNHAGRLGLNCILTTNGVLITDQIAKQLKQAGIFEMKVSFEGGRERNDSIRGRGVYERALRGMKYLKERGINISVRLTLHRGSINGLDELFADLADVDVTSVKVATVKPIGRAALPENDDLFGFSATMGSLYQILDLGSRYGIDMHFSSDDFPFRPEEINDDKPRFQDHRNCGAGFETVYVSPSGDVMPCSSMQDVILGNIAEADFATVWNGEQTREYRRSAERCDIQRLCCCENIRTVHGQDSS